ncbi:hypothetical protein [Cupriavidus pauculus]|uniref:hypothetical protein n=1 Tax=Cupriavidus pauculus TaxID=82633 RepID=UPI0007859A33|nr:hypothetical protein [Cupriavidus pauculus]
MKLLSELQRQVGGMGTLRRAWFTSFSTDIEFVETYVLPATLGANTPRNRLEYEQLQQELTKEGVDFRVFCDPRFLETNRIKRTCIPVHGIRPQRLSGWFSEQSLFHAKVIYLEDREGKRIIGAGSANLTLSGWGRNLEVFQFFEITTYANYRQVRQFFEELCLAADIPCELEDRRKFSRKQENWRFVHSYQDEAFPEQLFAGVDDADLAVWSPYLPRDLASFIGKLEAAADVNGLNIHLVADRIEGKYLRTEWNDEVSRMKEEGRLTFYDCPAERHPNTELCHAKLWKVGGNLAIGSWNFTGPGSNSLRDDQGNWSRDNNVEAGFIIDDRHDWSEACGLELNLGEADCASEAQLEEEALIVSSLPPFDLHVSFDWHTQAYIFCGKWLSDDKRDGYSILLPGVAGPVPLVWNAQRAPMQPGEISVDDSVLLRDRVFKVIRADKEIQRGLVSELSVNMRRAQSFDTLQDLLEAFVQGDDPQTLPELPFRIPLDTDVFPDDTFTATTGEDMPLSGQNPANGGISYFRLFQSTRAYQQKLLKIERLEELERQVFSWPGCLLELVGKTRAELQRPGGEIFNWFLVSEVNLLCEVARKRRASLIRGMKEREPVYTAVPKKRWDELDLVPQVMPVDVQPRYSELVKDQCNYV